MTMIRKRPLAHASILRLSTALFAGSISSAAVAQSDASRVENIVVTGSRTSRFTDPTTAGSRLSLTALETPASVQVLSGDDIRARGDISVNEAVTRATGITTQATLGNGGNSVAARGFSAASVAFLYDGIRNMASLGNLGFPFDPWTVERVEVLNGPASVLFGTGGIGGAINVIPRRPSTDAEHSVRVSAGSFDTYRAALDSTGPISDRWLYRFDASTQSSDGYVDRGASDSTAASGAVTFLASEDLRLTLSSDYADIQPMNYVGLPLVDGEARKSLRKVNYVTDDVDVQFIERTTRFNVDWIPSDALSVRNITSVIASDRLWKQGPSQLNHDPATNDIVRGGYGIYVQDQDQWNNQTELRWSNSLFGRDNTVSFGGDIEDLTFTRIVNTWPGITSAVDLESPVPGVHPTVPSTVGPAQTMRVSRYSLFAENHLEVSTTFSLIGGLRYDRSRVHRDDLVTPARVSRTYDPINWRVGAVYEMRPQLTFYAQYSKATDAISNICCISAAQLAFRPSDGKQTEIGMKQSTRNNRLEWSVAAYEIRKTDLLVPDPFNIGTLIQVGAQSSRGFEASLRFDASENFIIEMNGTVLDPQFDDFQELSGGVLTSLNGNTPTGVPRKSANVWASWSFRPQWLLQAGIRYVGERYINTANTLGLPSYKVVDANLGWQAGNSVRIDVRAANVFDEFYATTYVSNGRGGGQWQLGVPRSYEFIVTAGF